MPNLIDSPTTTPEQTLLRDWGGQQIVQTSDGYYVIVYFYAATTLKYAITLDNGKTWNTPITISTDGTSAQARITIDSNNNIYIADEKQTVSGTNRNIRMIKLAYQGNGVWSAGSWKNAYTSNNASRLDILKVGSRIWLILQEYNYSTNVWQNTRVTYSDDDGDNWASLTTLITSGGDGWLGYKPTLGLRNGNLVAVYGNGSNDFAIREWNGSSWGSQVTASGMEGFYDGGSIVTIGTTAYVVYAQAQQPRGIYLRTWNGSAVGSAVQIWAAGMANAIAGTDGTNIFVIGREVSPYQGGVIGTRFVEYVVSGGTKKHHFIIDDPNTATVTDISVPTIPLKFTGYPVIAYAKANSGTKLYSVYFNFDFGIKISKSGYDVTDPDQKQLLHSSYPLFKAHLSGTGTLVKSSSSGQQTVEITHNLGYIPRCFVYGHYLNMNDYPTATVVARYKLFSWRDTPGLRLWDYYRFWADTTKLYIRYTTNSFFSPSISLPYIYFIFKDEG